MKYVLSCVQLIFLVMALLPGLSIHSDRDILALPRWQMVAGLSQLFIAIVLSYKYWKSSSLKRLFTCYWFVAAIEFILLNKLTTGTGTWYYMIVFIVPWCIAAYFSTVVFICFYAKK